MLILAKAFSAEGGARKEQESLRKRISGMWGFLAYRSAGVRLGLQCLLAVSAEENMRFQFFKLNRRTQRSAPCSSWHISISLQHKTTSGQADAITCPFCASCRQASSSSKHTWLH